MTADRSHHDIRQCPRKQWSSRAYQSPPYFASWENAFIAFAMTLLPLAFFLSFLTFFLSIFLSIHLITSSFLHCFISISHSLPSIFLFSWCFATPWLTITWLCSVLLTTAPMSKAFPLTIPSTETVGQLRNTIHFSKLLWFKNLEAEDLTPLAWLHPRRQSETCHHDWYSWSQEWIGCSNGETQGQTGARWRIGQRKEGSI